MKAGAVEPLARYLHRVGQGESQMANAYPPDVLAENLFKLTMLGVFAVIAAMVLMGFYF